MKKLSVAKFNQITAEIAEARKPKPREPFKPSVAPLTPDQAVQLFKNWRFPIMEADETIGDLLLLISSLAEEEDVNKRWAIQIAFEKWLMPYSNASDRALEELRRNRLAVAQKQA